jgi:hypothetical protein
MVIPVNAFTQNLRNEGIVSGEAVEQATAENITELISTLNKNELEFLIKLIKKFT